jgi:hypothetical protein
MNASTPQRFGWKYAVFLLLTAVTLFSLLGWLYHAFMPGFGMGL